MQTELEHALRQGKTMNIKIRPCLLSDLETLRMIGLETFDETFRPMNSSETIDQYLEKSFSFEKLEQELGNTYCKFYFIYSGSSLAGYIKLNYAPAQSDINDSNSVEVERIYVRKEHQGKGVGKMSLEYVFQQAELKNKIYVWLGVWEKNVNAISFYKKIGFEEVGQHSFRIGNEIQSDLIMKKVVTSIT